MEEPVGTGYALSSEVTFTTNTVHLKHSLLLLTLLHFNRHAALIGLSENRYRLQHVTHGSILMPHIFRITSHKTGQLLTGNAAMTVDSKSDITGVATKVTQKGKGQAEKVCLKFQLTVAKVSQGNITSMHLQDLGKNDMSSDNVQAAILLPAQTY